MAIGRRQCITSASAAAGGLAASRWSQDLARALALRPNAWLAIVTGVPPGKERCSCTGLISYIWDAKRWVQEESVPDFLLLERGPEAWHSWRGYLGDGSMRRDGWHDTLREARSYAASLTGGLLAPWVAVPHRVLDFMTDRERLIAFARSRVSPEQRL